MLLVLHILRKDRLVQNIAEESDHGEKQVSRCG